MEKKYLGKITHVSFGLGGYPLKIGEYQRRYCKMETKYVLVTFPEIQDFMEHPRFGECIFCQEIEGHPCPDSAYMVPVDLYYEVERL